MLNDLVKAQRRGGHVESVDDMIVTGWAADLTQSVLPAALVLLVDDQIIGSFRCTDPRPDVNALDIPGTRLGFRFKLPDIVGDGQPHRIRICFSSGEGLTHGEQMRDMLTVHFPLTTVQGTVDGMFGNTVRGWAFREDRRTQARTGEVTLEVRSSGLTLGRLKAALDRSDVAAVHGCQPHCGFSYTIPPALRNGQPFELSFHALPEDTPIAPAFRGRVLVQDSVDRLAELYGRVEALSTQIYGLKDELRQILATDEYTLETYHDWATSYYETLRARVAAERATARYAGLLGVSRPTVSIVCPVYKPRLADLVAAIASVRGQSWPHWELILVDDGSRSAALTQAMREACAADARIRVVAQKRNGGISAATNAGIAAAEGEWIALLDHDDLLVDVALEVMLLAARHTGAKMLYSDEDKVDGYGFFSAPHFKTDWNYRLLLTNNYVCHFLMVEAATLRQAGPLNPRFDGVQDHDLVLRLSERLAPGAIHHVAELLYHWRTGESSTATSASAKPYVMEAGRQAVLDHLGRRGLSATVEALYDAPVYEVRWQSTATPSVTILVPFRDQVELTRTCVARLLATTDYPNYRLVLIDNWSTAPGTQAWLDEVRSDGRVQVVRIEEPFNYARINNAVAERCDSDFLLFLNNDVFVREPDWLRRMVDEASADPQVGIVGVKLLYPDQTVQHAGVVLGVGGVASHAFRLLAADDRGYANRAVCAQELSAVTAACMLCRTDAFKAVGMFDERHLAVAFNDVDLCLRVGQAGYRVVMTPAVVAEHHESVSRGNDFASHHLPRFYGENQTMMDRWGDVIRADPFYNPHFSHESGMFDTLSSASLRVASAPPLLRETVRPSEGR